MRNKTIDFLRGVIAIHIVMLHTVFHSGESYVPDNVQGWFLLFDVPIFLVISGMILSFNESPRKKMKEILTILFKWGIFVIFCYVYLSIIGYIKGKKYISIIDIPSLFVFKPSSNINGISVLSSSLWFMKPFIISTILYNRKVIQQKYC